MAARLWFGLAGFGARRQHDAGTHDQGIQGFERPRILGAIDRQCRKQIRCAVEEFGQRIRAKAYRYSSRGGQKISSAFVASSATTRCLTPPGMRYMSPLPSVFSSPPIQNVALPSLTMLAWS